MILCHLQLAAMAEGGPLREREDWADCQRCGRILVTNGFILEKSSELNKI